MNVDKVEIDPLYIFCSVESMIIETRLFINATHTTVSLLSLR